LAVERKSRINKKFGPHVTLMIDTDIFSLTYFWCGYILHIVLWHWVILSFTMQVLSKFA